MNRGIFHRFVVSCGIFLSFASTSTGLAADNNRVRLYYTANRQGEIEPCGCQVHQIGGIDRLVNFLKKDASPVPSLFLDSGDTFFTSKTLNPTRTDQERLRAKLIAESYAQMGVSAFTPGEKDFALGLPFLKELAQIAKVATVSANLVGADGKPLFERVHLFTVGGAKVAVIGVTDPKAVEGVEGVRALPVEESLTQSAAEAKQSSPDLLLLLSELGLAKDREIAAKFSFDGIFGARSLEALTDPEKVGKVWIVQPQIQGQQIGSIELVVSRPEVVNHRIIDLDKELDLPKNFATALLEKYRARVRELAIAASEGAVTASADHPYVANPSTCRGCHQKQHDFWATTKHSSAYLVLFAKNQHFDADCIGCHSLGFQEAGGFSKIARPIVLDPEPKRTKKGEPFVEQMMKRIFTGDKGGPLDSREEAVRYKKLHSRYQSEVGKLNEQGKLKKLFIGVQCEHCHGNRDGHPSPDVPTVKKVDLATCKQCHTPPHAKAFDPATLPKVACPIASKM